MFKNAKVVSAGVNPVEYHNQKELRGTPEYFMSPSALREFYRCPSRWKKGYESPDSDAKRYGSLIDCMITTPSEFEKRYVVRPETYEVTLNECPECKSLSDSESCRKCKKPRVPKRVNREWNGNSSECAKWVAAKEESGLEVISKPEYDNAQAALKALRDDEIISTWLDSCDMQVLVRGEWHDPDTGLVIPVRCLMDFVPRLDTEFSKCLGDFKTTRNAGLSAWSRWCFNAGYHVQAGFDTDLYIAATNEDRMTWCFICQENYEPWQTAKRMLSVEHGLDLGRLEYKRMLKLYARCLKTGKWPHYDDHDEAIQGWSLIVAEPFVESRLMFEPNVTFEGEDDMPENVDDESERTDLIP